jgi:hypothetical protein
MQKDTRRPHTSLVAGHLLLALILAFAPLLAGTQGMPKIAAAADHAASGGMPCHPAEVEPPAQQDACPHCTADGTAAKCHCCGHAAPAGLNLQAGIVVDSHPGGAPAHAAVSDPLPESSGERLYRPPIFHS